MKSKPLNLESESCDDNYCQSYGSILEKNMFPFIKVNANQYSKFGNH